MKKAKLVARIERLKHESFAHEMETIKYRAAVQKLWRDGDTDVRDQILALLPKFKEAMQLVYMDEMLQEFYGPALKQQLETVSWDIRSTRNSSKIMNSDGEQPVPSVERMKGQDG